MSAKITRRRVAWDWMRWAGRGNGRLGLLIDATDVVLSFLDAISVGVGWNSAPRSMTGRVRYILRKGPDVIDGVWQELDGPRVLVAVVHGGKGRYVEGVGEGHAFTLPIAALTPLGTLDYPPRPRFTTGMGVELDSGVLVRAGGRIATLLLRKCDLAVIAVLAGWPSPTELPHGQKAQDILRAAS